MALLPEGAPPLGFGAMRLSELDRDRAESIALLHRALDAGIRLIDTADVYAPSASEIGHNERLCNEALSTWAGDRRAVIVATKGGLRREGKKWIPDGRAKHVKAACERSLSALDTDAIDLYQLHALDPKVPARTTLRALESLVKSGRVRRVGLCNVNLEALEEAVAMVPVASVQVALGPFDQTPLKNGVADFCARNGILLIAHSPLGGHRNRRRLEKDATLRALAEAKEATPSEVALAWLRSLPYDVVALPGATRLQSLQSSLRSLELALTEGDRETLARAYPSSRARRAPESTIGNGEVVLFVGYPGAGKSTAAEAWVARGFARLNRDAKGGSLSALLPELDERLGRGERRIVLDNTYPRRASRFDVVELAWRHGVPVRCVWLETSLEQAQLNAVTRMVRRYGRLLDPAEMKKVSKTDPNAFPPEAQFRYRRELEPPRAEEGFLAIDRVAFDRERAPGRTGRAVFFDPKDDGIREKLVPLEREGFRLLGVSFEPGRRESHYVDAGIEVAVCNHPPPASCWCRKPFPGLGVLFLEKYALDPPRCLVVGDSPAERGFAERLGVPLISGESLGGRG